MWTFVYCMKFIWKYETCSARFACMQQQSAIFLLFIRVCLLLDNMETTCLNILLLRRWNSWNAMNFSVFESAARNLITILNSMQASSMLRYREIGGQLKCNGRDILKFEYMIESNPTFHSVLPKIYDIHSVYTIKVTNNKRN